jgi:CDP-diacylglycerol--serine O-phosphatidyltransferase
VLAALFIALLLTFPSLTLALGSIIYLALIPVSAYRYYQLERADERRAKTQTGKSPASEPEPAQTPALALVKPAKSPGGRQSGAKS